MKHRKHERQPRVDVERERAGGASRERGAALVVVMVFMLGILALLGYLIPTARMSIVAQSHTERAQLAQLVLQSAIHEAIWEARLETDLDGTPDGAGARGTSTLGDALPGVPFLDTSGNPIGYYASIVDNSPADGPVLYVVAGVPDLAAYAGAGASLREKDRVLLAAKLKFESFKRDWGDRTALAFAGSASSAASGNFGFQGTSPGELNIDVEGYDSDGDGTADKYVPAVNISDPDLREAFLREVVYDGAYNATATELEKAAAKALVESLGTSRASLTGGSATDMSSASYHYEDTVTDSPSDAQRVNEESLQALIDYWREPLSQTAGHTITDKSAVYTASDELVVLDAGNHFEGTITGSGTLLIKGGVTLRDSARIDWQGDVIIAPPDGTSSTTAVNVTDGSDIDIDGNLVLVNDGSNGKLSLVIQDSTVDVGNTSAADGGGILLLNGSDNGAEVRVDKGGQVDAQGVLGLMGHSVDFVVGGGNADSHFDFHGSVIIAAPPGTDDGKLHKFLVEKNGYANLTFRNSSFENGVASTETGRHGGTPPPLVPPKYEVFQVGYAEVMAGTIWPGTFQSILTAAGGDPVGFEGVYAGN